MALLSIVLLLTTINVILGICDVNNVPEQMVWEIDLKKDLKCAYKAYIPLNRNISTFSVDLRFIMKYFNFDSKEEVFTMQSMMLISWSDDRLKWDPEKYNGIKEIEMSSSSFWIPGIRLFNNAEFDDYIYLPTSPCHVMNTGNAFCVSKMVHTAICSVKLTNWPYDVQQCHLEFGPWTSKWTNFRLNVTSRAISMLGAEYGAEWFISDYKQVVDHNSEKQLKMTFVLEREAGGLASVVVYPSVILTALSITSLFLDVRVNVRLGVTCFCMFGHYYFLSELGQDIPKASVYSPNLLLYYRGSMILTALILLMTMLLYNICKLKSTPQNYIISINDYVYNGYGKYLVYPRWDFDDVMINSKCFSQDWTKFANVVNSVSVFVIIITYIGLYSSLMPQPVPVNY